MVNRIIFILSLLGLFISVFLAYEYSQTDPVLCPIGGSGCELVRQSEFSSFLGVSIPLYGVAFYVVISLFSIILSNKYIKGISDLRVVGSFFGFAFGVYLTYAEAFLIKAYCIWCIISFIISILILYLVLFKNKKHENRN